MGLDAVLDHLGTSPAEVGAFFDLDGTLAQIEDDPTQVRPVEGVAERVHELAVHLGVVAIVSGRPVAFLDRFFDDADVQLSGLYGLEHRVGGQVLVDSAALEWLPAMSAAADSAREHFGLEVVEDKRYSLTVHYRGLDDAFAQVVHTWAESIAGETGLHARVAKKSVELHPPTGGTKGDVVERLVSGLRSAVYFGDDVGDIPAFERLGALADSGQLRSSARVLVGGPEAPSQLVPLATDTVTGPGAVVEALDRMLERVR